MPICRIRGAFSQMQFIAAKLFPQYRQKQFTRMKIDN